MPPAEREPRGRKTQSAADEARDSNPAPADSEILQDRRGDEQGEVF